MNKEINDLESGRSGSWYKPGWKDWYRGDHCNFVPRRQFLDVHKHILSGFVPSIPIISVEDKIAAFGSCFADSIQNRLRERGYNIPHITECNITRYGDGLTTTFTVLQQLQYAYEEKKFIEDLWWKRPDLLAETNDEDQINTKLFFDSSNVFIITFGLSEVWRNKSTKEVFWRAIPVEYFNPVKHEFYLSTVDENFKNLVEIVRIIRTYRGNIPIIFTLSPVSFLATFRNIPGVVANGVSKAILRVALDLIMTRLQDDPNLFYWPSYELVHSCHSDAYQQDGLHPRPEIVAEIMDLFCDYYLIPKEDK